MVVVAECSLGELDGFRFALEAENLSPATIKNYTQCVRVYFRYCACKDISPYAVGRNDLLQYLGQLRTTHAQSTVRLFTVSLKVFYAFLKTGKQIKTDPAKSLVVHKQVARPVQPFSRDEIAAMFAQCKGHRERACFLLLLGGGLRRSEVSNILTEDVDFSSGTIRILGKGNKYRIIAPGVAAMKELRFTLFGETELVDRQDDDYIWRRVRAWAKAAGVSGRSFTHRFRYTFAVEFTEAGGGIDHLATILGHSSITQSMFYSRVGRERRALEAQRKLNPADRFFEPDDESAVS